MKKLLLLVVLALVVIISCNKKEKETEPEMSKEVSVLNVTSNSIVVLSAIDSDGGLALTEYGFCYSQNQEPTIENEKVSLQKNAQGEYSMQIGDLKPNTTYYVRAYAINKVGVGYSETITITTEKETPQMSSGEGKTEDVTENSAKVFYVIASDGGATITEKGFCYSTKENPTIADSTVVVQGKDLNMSATLTGLSGGTTYYVRAYATNSVGTSYGEQIMVKTPQGIIVNGAIQAAFSVSSTKKVYFSMGNLQYHCTKHIWQFALHQYDMIGKNNSNISSTYSGWIDLFGWGTSGFKSNYPYRNNRSYYGVEGDKDADIAGTNYDWGVYNKISNGGNTDRQWRTLTRVEWRYVLSERPNASALKGFATVNGVTGLILLPDNWITPAGIPFTSGKKGFDSNTYTTSEWAKMEANGAVFLPAAGSRDVTDVSDVGYRGCYWSSSASGDNDARYLYFYDYLANVSDGGYRYYGRSVRLVRGL